MVTQKAISAKIDGELLTRVDEYLADKFCTRNRLINYALQMWLDAARLQQREAVDPDDADTLRLRRQFELRWLGGGRASVLRFPSSQEP